MMFMIDPYRGVVIPTGCDFGSHRYWRIAAGFTLGGGGSNFGVTEIQLFYNGTDQTIAFISQGIPSGGIEYAQRLVDGATGSGFASAYTAAVFTDSAFYLRFDLRGSPAAIDTLKFAARDEASRYPTSFVFQYSDDGSSWTTQATISGLSYPGNDTLSAGIDVSGGGATSHRFWQLKTIVTGGGASLLEISEVQIFVGATAVLPIVCTAQSDPRQAGKWMDNDLVTFSSITGNIDFDLRVAKQVNGFRFGGSSSNTAYPTALTLRYSDDGSNWITANSVSGIVYPGAAVLSDTILFPCPVGSGSITTWDSATKSAGFTLSGGDLLASEATSNSETIYSTGSGVGASGGKFYVEIDILASGGTDSVLYLIDSSNRKLGCREDGTPVTDSGAGTYSGAGGITYATGDIAMFFWNADAGTVYMGKNGSWPNGQDPTAGTGAMWTSVPIQNHRVHLWTDNDAVTHTYTLNCGATAFSYTPPLSASPF